MLITSIISSSVAPLFLCWSAQLSTSKALYSKKIKQYIKHEKGVIKPLKENMMQIINFTWNMWVYSVIEPAEPAEPLTFCQKKLWRNKTKTKNTLTLFEISFSGIKKITLKEKYVIF